MSYDDEKYCGATLGIKVCEKCGQPVKFGLVGAPHPLADQGFDLWITCSNGECQDHLRKGYDPQRGQI